MILRIARPVSDLTLSRRMIIRGFGWEVLAEFEDHQGFDGCILGVPGAQYHLEITYCRTHPVVPQPTEEDLIVLYVPSKLEFERRSTMMLEAGFTVVNPYNPYWGFVGKTFEDQDGYRFVIQQEEWVR